mmetsp:Transcript_58962/g.169314  ORF Transcript_58962/g.169314 Transcript_58962/m.169314 type:complete len:216 (+) Transcript_58962:785-1432(+)
MVCFAQGLPANPLGCGEAAVALPEAPGLPRSRTPSLRCWAEPQAPAIPARRPHAGRRQEAHEVSRLPARGEDVQALHPDRAAQGADQALDLGHRGQDQAPAGLRQTPPRPQGGAADTGPRARLLGPAPIATQGRGCSADPGRGARLGRAALAVSPRIADLRAGMDAGHAGAAAMAAVAAAAAAARCRRGRGRGRRRRCRRGRRGRCGTEGGRGVK